MSEKEEAKVRKEYMAMRKLYVDRRRTAIEILEQMGEAQGKTRKVLMEELGLEADEEYGVEGPKQFPILS